MKIGGEKDGEERPQKVAVSHHHQSCGKVDLEAGQSDYTPDLTCTRTHTHTSTQKRGRGKEELVRLHAEHHCIMYPTLYLTTA